ncbi:MAG: 4-(cytidine 5'-diphospho)-2-C-methyl-D-erythritol kinase [Verrucomicrobia bacterium RIFCSPHIGHO2_12_FULL_41_10]|nr:MAG: 4-(cytidine 5'-diphospho)-2-C-methyl-D-erythritol kinase [Verrucomicrobia bacterium RIFCSPHIGHO2_12_FULL_41_10]HLB34151.1 4-(cytidine 5'-diphospho)-2-C-methyl-D-erythritol kinase [Chthoniobacterales bacterium]
MPDTQPPTLSLTAPAKINLSLRILGKHSDGYHEIETLMAPLTLADELEITCAHTGTPNPSKHSVNPFIECAPTNHLNDPLNLNQRINPPTAYSLQPTASIRPVARIAPPVTLLCNDPSLPCGPENLCVKAALAFQEASGINTPIAITLLKRIPHGAGLGGGSSDAAAVLRGMNQLFGEPLVIEELHQIAASLGSDIPFFLEPKSSWCHGRGELLQEANPLPPWRLLLIKPPFSIATAWAYNRLEAIGYRLEEKNEEKENCKLQETGDREQVENELDAGSPTSSVDGVTIVNDLELPVFEKYLLLPVLKEWLQERKEIRHAWMTGSGSTMVALLREEITPEAITMLKKEITSDFGATFWIKETGFRENQ